MAVPAEPLARSRMLERMTSQRPIKVAAFDPAMRNWGMAKLLVDPIDLSFVIHDLRLLSTSSEAGKTVRKSSDDLRRATESYTAAHDWAAWSDLIVAEVPSGSQSSRASLGAGMSIGLLAALGYFRPLIQVDPISVKKTVTGRKTASKEEMIDWASREYPDAPWLRRKLKGELVMTNDNEHLADAVAIGRTALQTAEFRSAVRMMTSIMH